MKLFKTINLILIFIFSYTLATAKPLPPGTGNSVPANILFLVDKSQSMHDPATGNNRRINMRPPTDVVGRGDGNYFVSGVDESGYYYWNASQNEIVQTNSIFVPVLVSLIFLKKSILTIKSSILPVLVYIES